MATGTGQPERGAPIHHATCGQPPAWHPGGDTQSWPAVWGHGLASPVGRRCKAHPGLCRRPPAPRRTGWGAETLSCPIPSTAPRARTVLDPRTMMPFGGEARPSAAPRPPAPGAGTKSVNSRLSLSPPFPVQLLLSLSRSRSPSPELGQCPWLGVRLRPLSSSSGSSASSRCRSRVSPERGGGGGSPLVGSAASLLRWRLLPRDGGGTDGTGWDGTEARPPQQIANASRPAEINTGRGW